MRSYFFLGLNFLVVAFSLWLHDRARVWMARRCGDLEAASRQRTADNPFARVDWIGSVLLPAFLLWRRLPLLGWTKPLDIDAEKLHRPRRAGLLIALAGPAANLLLAVTGIVLVKALQSAGMFPARELGNMLIFFCQANACLAAFNLLPIPPLAMATAAELLLNGDALTAFEEIKPYGFLLVLAGVFFNFFDFITIPVGRLVYSLLGL
ncbi:MAG: site-2 protease family protein [Candidatus Aminicenantes bacterium]|nr:site-2 protease family protein [Candidatus Aminicenantes bacterium]